MNKNNWKFDRWGFHAQGNCWKLFAAPTLNEYRAGDLVWVCWWRLYLVFERRA